MRTVPGTITATQAAEIAAAALRVPTHDRHRQTATHRDTDAFLSECVATWIAARLCDRVVEPTEIAESCATHLGAKIGDYRQDGWPIVSFTLAGVSGQARCLHGALTDWIDQWQQATGRRVSR